ncbi:hypothetical protein NE237_029106 [Protea cynaroides]|uniref:Uncharacterized protein n=1 Tax=Protea cynaroides TaxID=273540 RepID=A0A9Q0GRK7_9MAGN|nr:hypothetical protein NE237_029106 [Protea cynaroides]
MRRESRIGSKDWIERIQLDVINQMGSTKPATQAVIPIPNTNPSFLGGFGILSSSESTESIGEIRSRKSLDRAGIILSIWASNLWFAFELQAHVYTLAPSSHQPWCHTVVGSKSVLQAATPHPEQPNNGADVAPMWPA